MTNPNTTINLKSQSLDFKSRDCFYYHEKATLTEVNPHEPDFADGIQSPIVAVVQFG
jgi:hypothetical protein